MPAEGHSAPLTAGLATEKRLVEENAEDMFRELGWRIQNLEQEQFGSANSTGRQSNREPFLPALLKDALRRLNPDLPGYALDQAEVVLREDRSAMLPVAANREIHALLRDGIPVDINNEDGTKQQDRAILIDWRNPANNEFLLASQFWLSSHLYTRRPDAVGFVNGIPLLVAEWKAPTVSCEDAYQKNLRDYRDTIPHLFYANGLVILSNGLEAVAGPSHAPWEVFAPWKRIDEEGASSVALEQMIRATCHPERFLDIIENFVLFEEARGGLRKVLAKYHQYLGVNRAVDAVDHIDENDGRLGVFWHTQGSGKSLSAAMFTEKVLRRKGGNWTFVVVTDRQELDDQIATGFARVGALRKDVRDCQAQSRKHLRELLAGQERYVFTLIHKFGAERGEEMPVLSDRSDIIVITDEAHRSQYDQLAANMRQALPNASFIGFTGTPLIAGEELTRDVFGDYLSIYDFQQSVEDGATVPLFYESRKPEVHLTGEIRDELEDILEEAELSEDAEKRLHRQFSNQYHLITRSDRLDEIAEDVARHFAARGYLGKGMFVAIDKATAVAMFERVQSAWKRLLEEKKAELADASAESRDALSERLAWMQAVDMAVVVSSSQNEIADLEEKGLDIRPHRKRMREEDLETKFKNPDDPLSLVFVCAMWITGFDVPTCSTMYVDKPMKNHTLMQTIARANRRAPGKEAGLIVDYIGVFQNLQKALAIYGSRGGGEMPARDKSALVEKLNDVLGEAVAFCEQVGVDPFAILEVDKMDRLALIGKAVEALIAPDERRRSFLSHSAAVGRAYKAILPDVAAAPYLRRVAAFQVLAEAIRGKMGPEDLSGIYARIEALLDERVESIAISAPIPENEEGSPGVSLSGIDFEKLAAMLNIQPKTAAERARTAAEQQAYRLVAQNPTRKHLAERLEELVTRYNANSIDAERFFEELKKLVDEMDDEERRAAREELTEQELAIFDLLTRPEPPLTKAEQMAVKAVARELHTKLSELAQVRDWQLAPQPRAEVRSAIRFELNRLPEHPYPEHLWNEKVDAVWQHVFQTYRSAGSGVRAAA
jgi:type I restriction enzyme R subunit